jgi:hypothetical protein
VLSEVERSELASLEGVVSDGLQTFVKVGNALAVIRDRSLYRETHGTFEDYCRERWGLKRQRAYELIAASSVAANLSEISDIKESHASELVRLEPASQRVAWDMAVETAPGGKVTAAHVAVVADVVSGQVLNACEQCGKQWLAELESCPYCTKTPEQRIVDLRESIKRAHVSHNSGNNEWYTPEPFIAAAREVMGAIDCDPASSEVANATVQAERFFTKDDDGLRQAEWGERVWMNPPYAQPLISEFAANLVHRLEDGQVREACVLVNNATEARWFRTMSSRASAMCLVDSRVKFIDSEGKPSGAPLQGQVVMYFGENASKFADAFAEQGEVWRPWR